MNNKIKKIILIVILIVAVGGIFLYSFYKRDNLEYMQYKEFFERLESGPINTALIEDKNVTLFWQKYYDYIEKNYPKLNIKRYEGPRGSNAWWPGFIVPVKGLKIDHKSNRGDVDLSFEGLGNYYSEISNLLDGYLDENMIIVQTGKSMSIRIKVPIVKFNENFEDYIYEVNESLKAVERLYNLVNKINYNEILKLKEK